MGKPLYQGGALLPSDEPPTEVSETTLISYLDNQYAGTPGAAVFLHGGANGGIGQVSDASPVRPESATYAAPDCYMRFAFSLATDWVDPGDSPLYMIGLLPGYFSKDSPGNPLALYLAVGAARDEGGGVTWWLSASERGGDPDHGEGGNRFVITLPAPTPSSGEFTLAFTDGAVVLTRGATAVAAIPAETVAGMFPPGAAYDYAAMRPFGFAVHDITQLVEVFYDGRPNGPAVFWASLKGCTEK